jgi:YVTN family beta-propeller protein
MILAATAILVAALWAPLAAAHDDTSGYVFVPNRGSADIAVIDSRTDRVVARIKVGNVPHQVALSESLGKLIASNTEDNTISIINLDGFATEATIALGVEPEHMAVSPAGNVLAVGNIGAGTVSLVSLDDNVETARIEGLYEPHNLTFSSDGALLYAANLGANHVTVIDVASATVINEIPVAEPAAYGAATTAGEYQGIINVTPTFDGRLGFAAHGEGDVLAVIDLATQRTIKRIALGDTPWRAFPSADGRYMLVPNNGDRTVSVISVATLEVVATLPGAADMTGINGAGSSAFVISRGDNKIVVIDLAAMAVSGEISLPGSPETGVITADGGKLYVALGSVDQVAVIDTATAALIATVDGVGSEPWGATMAGVVGYCH